MIASQKEVTLANLPENSAEWRTTWIELALRRTIEEAKRKK